MNVAWILASVMLIAGLANADSQKSRRYLVTFKSKQGFSAMNNHWSQFDTSKKLQKPLQNINAVVLKSPSLQTITSLKNHPEVAAVQAEYFLPSPKPANGFTPGRSLWKARAQPQFVKQYITVDTTSHDTTPVFNEGAKTPWGITAVHAGAAWVDSKAGANARILILDTGIDPDHQDLEANFEQGRNFTQNEIGEVDATEFADQEGHGTHVAGTIAASYNEKTGFTGVAPKAKILMGRVCGKEGCSNISISEGIDWGIAQKVDIISMSLGGSFGSPDQELAVEMAEKAGVLVIAASGNDGSGVISFPAAYSSVYAVGAIGIDLKKTNFSQFGPELDIVAPGAAVVSSVPRGTGRDSLVKVFIGGVQHDAKSSAFSGTKLVSYPVIKDLVHAGLGNSEDFATANFKGKFALIGRGEIKFSEKVANAIASGAAGAVIYNNAPGLMQGSLTEDGSELNFPVVMIEQTSGALLVEALAKGTAAKAEISTMASDYAMFDGTSMAAPHVAGVAALVLSANKNLTPAQVRAILTATAAPLGPNLKNEYGAGNIQADKAVAAAIAQK